MNKIIFEKLVFCLISRLITRILDLYLHHEKMNMVDTEFELLLSKTWIRQNNLILMEEINYSSDSFNIAARKCELQISKFSFQNLRFKFNLLLI